MRAPVSWSWRFSAGWWIGKGDNATKLKPRTPPQQRRHARPRKQCTLESFPMVCLRHCGGSLLCQISSALCLAAPTNLQPLSKISQLTWGSWLDVRSCVRNCGVSFFERFFDSSLRTRSHGRPYFGTPSRIWSRTSASTNCASNSSFTSFQGGVKNALRRCSQFTIASHLRLG